MSTSVDSDTAIPDDIEDTLKGRYLTFRVGDEEYGIEILHVIEIVGVQEITWVPNVPSFVRGVINLRGHVIPVIDVRERFSMPSRNYDARTCVIVVRIDDVTVGMVVDTVNEVREIPESSISAPPQVGGVQALDFIKSMGRVGDNVLILLDVRKLIGREELESIS